MPLSFGEGTILPGGENNLGTIQNPGARATVKGLTNAYITDPRIVSPGQVLRAFHPREIQVVLYANGEYMYFPVDEISWNTTEQLAKHHGTGKGEGSALIGGDIDHDGSFSIVSFFGDDTRVDMLRQALRRGKDHRAVYFVIELNLVDYENEHASSIGGLSGVGQFGEDSYLPLIQLQWCKLKNNGVSVGGGGGVKTKFSFDFLTFVDLV